jgi:folate-dependent phosphoribosylglycinamide formyltransferase PurN
VTAHGGLAPSTSSHGRYPLRRRIDGDFDISDLLAAAPPEGPAEVVRSATADKGRASADEVRLLHSVETCAALRPPVADNCSALTADQASGWLTLAVRWIGIATTTDDLRFFDAACKLLGAACVSPSGRSGAISEQVSRVAHLIAVVTASLHDRLGRQLPADCQARPFTAEEAPQWPPGTARRPQRIALLAGEGSSTAARVAGMVDAAGVRLAGLCWFAQPDVMAPNSSYAQAWYPAELTLDEPAATVPESVAQSRADSWAQVSRVLRDLDPDLILLAGMPIVPVSVLGHARLGVVNAHNGALPGYRGMDAVAWAILGNDPIVCTLHLADPRPDRGPVLAAVTVPLAPAGTLRARVKAAQITLLARAASHVSSTGTLPPARLQADEQGRQFYRLHPHLKRILDSSPYGTGGISTIGRPTR